MDTYVYKLMEKVKEKEGKGKNDFPSLKKKNKRYNSDTLEEYIKNMELRMYEVLKQEESDDKRREYIYNHLKIKEGLNIIKQIE